MLLVGLLLLLLLLLVVSLLPLLLQLPPHTAPPLISVCIRAKPLCPKKLDPHGWTWTELVMWIRIWEKVWVWIPAYIWVWIWIPAYIRVWIWCWCDIPCPPLRPPPVAE